jgi:hypothetical protein
LVPEIAAAEEEAGSDDRGHEAADEYLTEAGPDGRPAHGLAGWNAQLTLLGTLAGFVFSVPGVALLKIFGAPGVLIFDTVVFAAGAIAGLRLRLPRGSGAALDDQESSFSDDGYVDEYFDPQELDPVSDDRWDDADPDVVALQPVAHPEVLLGLTANSLLRGIAGFLVFLLAFGLRRSHAALWWYGLALGASGVGALIGLSIVPRLRRFMGEPHMLVTAMVAVCLGAIGGAFTGGLGIQIALALLVGIAGAVGQPSFDAMTQRYVPAAVQGRAFARFATRQQLIWVIGALIPVAIAMPLVDGDIVIAAIAGGGAVLYVFGRFTRVRPLRRASRRHRR